MASKMYDGGNLQVRALAGVDLIIDRGEMVAVMGPSGCGKTTFLNTLSGIDDITDGEVEIDGQSIHDLSDKKRTRFRSEKMGFIFQSFNLLPVLSAAENVELPLLMAVEKLGIARVRANDALVLAGLEDQVRKRPAEMSGGQQQRVTIARALVNNPAIVWADEPIGNLGNETSAQVMDLLCRLNEENGQTFVVVTQEARRPCRTDSAHARRRYRMRRNQPRKCLAPL